MDDPGFVGGRKRVGDLDGDVQQTANVERASLDDSAQGLAVHQLGDDVRNTVIRAEIVDGNDVWMVQAAGGFSLLNEAALPRRIGFPSLRNSLDGYSAVQPRIAGRVDVAHGSLAQGLDNFVGADTSSVVQ